jgi:acyl-CoA synthetase (AMP-forming)/AMP-acid ligase II
MITRVKVYREELSPLTFLERSGDVYATRIAVEDGDRRYDYRQWRARARRLASGLRGAGLGEGDRIAFLALNSEPLLLAHFGVPQAGGILVAINTRLSADEIGYIVEHSGARAIFYSPELEPQLARVSSRVQRFDIRRDFEDLLTSGSDQPIEPRLKDEEETIAIDYTSGTTGRPKGVMYTHRGAYLNALGMLIEHKVGTESSYLWTLPMFHCNGWTFTWALPAVGARSVCIPRIDPPEVWRLFDGGGITHFCAAPTVLTLLVNHPAAHRMDRPIRVFTAAAPPSPTIIAQMAELNFELDHVYGLTESYGPFTINVAPPGAERLSLKEQARMKARQGVAHITAGQQRVVDAEMRDVRPDGQSMGEVIYRGNVVMKGYYGQPEATEEVFRGGWFHTGDLGVMHPDGQIELRDRKKDIIISGGENISTIEVERAILSHPAVMECAVVAIPDETWGEVPKAFVVLKPGTAATGGEIIEHCRGQLAHFKCPKAVEFGELPKTSTGKVQKFLLREREWRGHEKRIN